MQLTNLGAYLRHPLRTVGTFASLVRSGPRAYTKPVFMQVETTGVCNLDCVMCHRLQIIQGAPHMSVEDFTRALDEVRPLVVDLTGFGEPMLTPRLWDMVAQAKRRGIKVRFTTNGTVLHKHMESLLASRLDRLTISLDGTTRESFEGIRRGAHWDEVLANLEALSRAVKGRRLPEVVLAMVWQRENAAELTPFLELAHRLGFPAAIEPVILLGLQHPKDVEVDRSQRAEYRRLALEAIEYAKSVGSRTAEVSVRKVLDYLEDPARINGGPCYIPWRHVFVDVHGNVYPCCHFYRGLQKFGSLSQEGFPALWSGERYRAFRQALAADRRHNPICATCGQLEAEGTVSAVGWLQRAFGPPRRG